MAEARLLFRQGHVERATRTLERTADALGGAPTPLAGAFHRAWAIYLSLLGDVPRSLLHHQLALDCLGRLGDRFMLTKEYLSLGQTYLEIGELDHAEFFFGKAEESVEEFDDPPLEALLASRLGLLALVRGDLASASRQFERDLEISESSAIGHGKAFAMRNLGKVTARTGDPERGLELLRKSRAAFTAQADSLNTELTRLEEAAALLMARGAAAADEVHDQLERVASFFQRLGRPVMVAQVQGVRARLFVEQGKLELARQEMEDAARKFLHHRRPDRLFDSLLSFAEALLRRGEEAQAIHHLGWAHREAIQAGRPWMARTVIDLLGSISERAVMDVLGELLPPSAQERAEARPWYERTLVGSQSDAVRRLIEDARAVAGTEETVLIQGETGSGKEVLARFVHAHSERADATFVALNCGAIPDTLLEDEFFGHERGAFTGAESARIGMFEAAEGGLIFLDEVGELSPQGQVTLLRFIEDRQVRPVGASTSRAVDVRILTATNRDLRREVREGRFRQDLYFRLAVFPLHIPPLRQRSADLPDLAALFLAHNPHAQKKGIEILGDAAMRVLEDYAWPGNLRELDNVLRYAAIRSKRGRILRRDLPRTLFEAPVDRATFPTLDDVTRRHIQEAMDICGGHKGRAAALLGVHRNTLSNKLKTHRAPRR
jgi:two-component system response regulator HydG